MALILRLYKLVHFVICYHVWCAHFFVDLYGCWLGFYYYMYNCLLSLFFCKTFVHYLPDFGVQFLTFACFAVCTFTSVSLPGLAQLLLAIFFFLLGSENLIYILLSNETCFVVIVKVWRFCSCDYCLLVLAVKSGSWINLCLFVLIYLCVF